MGNILKKICFACWAIVLLLLMTGLITPEWKFALGLIFVYLLWSFAVKIISSKLRRKSAGKQCSGQKNGIPLKDIEERTTAEPQGKKGVKAIQKVEQKEQTEKNVVKPKENQEKTLKAKIQKDFSKTGKKMSDYELERFMVECNAYTEREERKERNKK